MKCVEIRMMRISTRNNNCVFLRLFLSRYPPYLCGIFLNTEPCYFSWNKASKDQMIFNWETFKTIRKFRNI